MSKPGLTTIVVCAFLMVRLSHAQHCPPIVESYLSEISLKQESDAIKIHVEYSKMGGRPKEKYQAYLLAYLERDANRIEGIAPQDLVNREVTKILHTQMIEQKKDGRYDLDFKIDSKQLAKLMIEHGKLTEKDRTFYSRWGRYQDRIRFTVFIPFLADEKYSVLEGLPEDKHECNYGDDRALLFQQLPYCLEIQYGELGDNRICIHGDRPQKSTK